MQILIRKRGTGPLEFDQDKLVGRLRFNLTRYEPQVRRLEMSLGRNTSADGANNHLVKIRVSLSGFPDIRVEDTEADLRVAIDRAVGRATRSVRQRIAPIRSSLA